MAEVERHAPLEGKIVNELQLPQPAGCPLRGVAFHPFIDHFNVINIPLHT